MSEKYAGADWIEKMLMFKKRPPMSEFGRRVADLLGEWTLGIYHIEREVKHKRTEWHNDRWIDIVFGGHLATYDVGNLTKLVILAFKYRIRFELAGKGPGYYQLTFYNSGFHPKQEHPDLDWLIKRVESFKDTEHKEVKK